MASSYKCPACGAPIAFTPETQNFACEYCLSKFTEQEIIAHFAEQDARAEQEAQRGREERVRAKSDLDWEHEAFGGYHCDSCGATVVTDESTVATFCYYCHNPVVISERLAGEFRPDQLIPFSVSQEAATEAFLRWVGGKRYVPKDFTSREHLEKMTGIYLPYWFTDAVSKVDFLGSSEKTRSWTSGNRRYTEHSVFEHKRQGEIFLDDTSISAYSKVDADLLNSIADYPLKQMKPFAKPYLSGFFADQFDIPLQEAKPKLAEQAYHYSMAKLRESLPAGAVSKGESVNVTLQETLYTLLPTWILTYKYLNKVYTFAMNGQTAEIVGELPVNKAMILRDALLLAALVLVLLLIGGYFIW